MAIYRLTAEAEDDLQGIADYTFDTFGPAQAEAYGLGLRNCFASLVDNPLLGRDYGFHAFACDSAVKHSVLPGEVN